MKLLENCINENFDLGSLSSFENDEELQRTQLTFDILEPYYKKIMSDLVLEIGSQTESFYNVALHSIVFNLGLEQSSSYIDFDEIGEEEIEYSYELIEYFNKQLAEYNFVEEVITGEESGRWKIENLYFVNPKNPFERLKAKTILNLVQEQTEKKINECVTILELYLAKSINRNELYKIFDINDDSDADEIERVNSILKYLVRE